MYLLWQDVQFVWSGKDKFWEELNSTEWREDHEDYAHVMTRFRNIIFQCRRISPWAKKRGTKCTTAPYCIKLGRAARQRPKRVPLEVIVNKYKEEVKLNAWHTWCGDEWLVLHPFSMWKIMRLHHHFFQMAKPRISREPPLHDYWERGAQIVTKDARRPGCGGDSSQAHVFLACCPSILRLQPFSFRLRIPVNKTETVTKRL
jgi:hypothetical protein